MKHKLYTTYLAKLKNVNLADDSIKILIMRFPPRGIKNQLLHVPELSPLKNILLDYKKDND